MIIALNLKPCARACSSLQPLYAGATSYLRDTRMCIFAFAAMPLIVFQNLIHLINFRPFCERRLEFFDIHFVRAIRWLAD